MSEKITKAYENLLQAIQEEAGQELTVWYGTFNFNDGVIKEALPFETGKKMQAHFEAMEGVDVKIDEDLPRGRETIKVKFDNEFQFYFTFNQEGDYKLRRLKEQQALLEQQIAELTAPKEEIAVTEDDLPYA
jgi:hypothetical protein